MNVSEFATRLRDLRSQRKDRVISGRKERVRRRALTRAERSEVLSKTASRCHICGAAITPNEDWQADHVLAHSAGGKHAVDNYLAACAICNNYRWNYDAEEFQWIRKLGVWLRTQIENGTPVGRDAGQKFCQYERGRSGRSAKQRAAAH